MKSRTMRRSGGLSDESDMPAPLRGGTSRADKARERSAFAAFLARHGGQGTAHLHPRHRPARPAPGLA